MQLNNEIYYVNNGDPLTISHILTIPAYLC